MAGQHYCLRWNNYQSNMTSVFHQLLQNEAFVDVTLACNDVSLKAHKVVLSACSSYFQKLLLENPCKHPTIIMPQDVCYADLKFIIDFVYKGEIDVSQTELQSLLKTADQLKIKGLCESPEDKENATSSLPLFFKSSRKSTSPKQFKLQEINRRHKFRRISQSQSSPSRKPKEELSKEREQQFEESEREQDDDNDMPVALDKNSKRNRSNKESGEEESEEEQDRPLNMSSHAIMTGQPLCFSQLEGVEDFPPEPPAPTAVPVGHAEMGGVGAVHPDDDEDDRSTTRTLLSDATSGAVTASVGGLNQHHHHQRPQVTAVPVIDMIDVKNEVGVDCVKFETLRSYDQDSLLEMDSHLSGPDHSMDSHDDGDRVHHGMMMAHDFSGMMGAGMSNGLDMNGSNENDLHTSGMKNNGDNSQQHAVRGHGGGPKTWTQEDMDMALDALRNHNMSLTKASATYGIPSTTLWQRAHRLGIDTPKKEGPTKSWTEENLNNALEALRTGTISANKASKAYGIPSSTLYKIARREGIRLAAPFNAAPTAWTPEDLERALDSIRTGQTSVQKASTEFGIPTGTLYGRCKREGIELSRSNPTPWSEDAMGEALEAVRLGHMSINQAAIHYNLPYSSLYGRFKRGIKYDSDNMEITQESQAQMDVHSFGIEFNNPSQIQYQNQTS